MKITVGIPAYNEEKNIAGIISRVKKYADSIIKISKSFDVEAKVIGRVEKAKSKKLTISTKFGNYIY